MHNGTEGGSATILNMAINVLGFRGKSQVEVLTLAERGTLVNPYLHECLGKFHAKDIRISSCEMSGSLHGYRCEKIKPHKLEFRAT